jgi:hypothetical protein
MKLSDEQVLEAIRSDFEQAEKFRNQVELEKAGKLSMLNGEHEPPSEPPQAEQENEPPNPP